ncbi:MAG: metal ABC transporter substrate-binding protein [Armatimonadota bacterium]|nr:metal ABC transporter substrate-binding protein [Armatimonadota bacterium]MDR7533798.1 metal ABC transporter substrate-binding protein [Armatimonadota bacterium]MDR7536673.1 metal ABC transporter substrate-binding protein [Armatimonadota bacterium]
MLGRIVMAVGVVAALVVALVAITRLGAWRQGRARVPVVATIAPLAEFAQRVGAERVATRVLVPPGIEAHDYEPSPQDLAAVARARLFVYVGVGFEPWVGRVVPTLPRRVGVVRATGGLPLIRAAGRPGAQGQDGWDPHVWLDPVLAQQIVEAIAFALVAADPDGARVYRDGAARTRADLERLHAEYQAGLAQCGTRMLVTTHTAFAYLARRYSLEHLGLAGVIPEADPAPGSAAVLAGALRLRGVRTVFVEPLGAARVAEAVAREIGARTASLDPLESLAPAGGDDYFRVMRRNLRTLRAELGCTP